MTKSKVMLIKVECLREMCFECFDENQKEMDITCIGCPHSRYELDE